VIQTVERGSGETALDASSLLRPPPASAPGLTLHPDFSQNHLVYLSFLSHESSGRVALRVVRLREVGGTLGEPATIFVAPLAAQAPDPRNDLRAGRSVDGPRLAFGPDNLLYVALPPGFAFEREPAASVPNPSVLVLTDEGRLPESGALPGITAHPLGFAWHPSTRALWLVLPHGDLRAVLQPAALSPGGDGGERLGLQLVERDSRRLMIHDAPAPSHELYRTILTGLGNRAPGTVRLMVPLVAAGVLEGIADPISDIVVGPGPTVFLATANAPVAREAQAAAGDNVVVRLRLRGK
jgi:hypothetical protein